MVHDAAGERIDAAFNGTNGPFTNVVTDVDVLTGSTTVGGTAPTPTTVVLGDGLVDPRVTGNRAVVGNDVAATLAAAEPSFASPSGVVDEGIEANQIITDNPEKLPDDEVVGGPSVLSRLDRDVLDQPGLTTVVVSEGLEDLLFGTTVDGLDSVDALEQRGYANLLNELHAAQVNIVLLPMTPCVGYAGLKTCDAGLDSERQAVNTWLTGKDFGIGAPQYYTADTDGTVGVPSGTVTVLDPNAATTDHANLSALGFGALTGAYLGPHDIWPLTDPAVDDPAGDGAPPDVAFDESNLDDIADTFAGEDDGTVDGSPAYVTDPTRGSVLSLDGAGQDITESPGFESTDLGPVLPTDQSSSVSAWVDLTALPSADDADIVSEDGSVNSVFALRYDHTDQRWAFGLSTGDTQGASMVDATAQFPVTAQDGWTHLVGVYNAVSHTLSLFVNGAADGTATISSAVTPSGPLAIGRGIQDGTLGEYFTGELSDVRTWRYALAPSQVGALALQIH